MGRDGRVHPQVIVGSGGEIFPVIPAPCYGGPCPVLLAPPLPWRHPQFGLPPPPIPIPPPPVSSAPAASPRAQVQVVPAPRRDTNPSLASPRILPTRPRLPVPGAPFTRDKEDQEP
jgi:hypothetical protein